MRCPRTFGAPWATGHRPGSASTRPGCSPTPRKECCRARLFLMGGADLDALVALMPFADRLGLVLEEATPDRVVARLDWAPHLCTSGGIMHGGVLMSLADTAGALVTFLGLPEGATTATITSTSQLFR